MGLSPTHAKALLERNALNMATKVQGGKPLTPKEVAMLESIVDGAAADTGRFAKNKVELCEALDVDRKTLFNWMKKEGAPETRPDGRYDVTAWREFAKTIGRRGDGYGDETPDTIRERARNVLLQNEKLEFQIKVLKKEFVPAGDVEKWGAELGVEIRKTIASIHIVAPSIVGLTIAEAESRLKELEDEILTKLHLLGARMSEMKEASLEE